MDVTARVVQFRIADGVLAQQYPPDGLVGRDYYRPTIRGAERVLADRVPKLRRAVRGEP